MRRGIRLIALALIAAPSIGHTGPAGSPGVALPKPTGPHRVGRTGFELVDRSREEIMTEDPDDRRRLKVHIWYPAAPRGGTRARYIDADPADPVFQRAYRWTGVEALQGVRTNSFDAAPLSSGRRRWPVVLFSHGLGSVSSLYSVLLENLASHGYVVVGVDHPYFSSAFTFADGTVVTNRSRRPPERLDDTAAERAALVAIREEEAIVQAQDLVFVADELTRLARPSSGSTFAGRLDLARLGVFGHSRGGFAAPHACYLDRRFRACLNLDGYRLTEAVMTQGIAQPYMHLQEEYPWEPPLTDAELGEAKMTRTQADTAALEAEREWSCTLGRMRGGAHVVTIAGARHASFGDGPLVAPAKYPQIAIDPGRALAIANAYVLAFFERTLRGRRRGPLESPPLFPEVKVERLGPGSGPGCRP